MTSDRAGTTLRLRRASADDSESVLEWRNDETTRRMSGSRVVVTREDHARWFAERLASPDSRMYVGVDDSGARLGMVRFDRAGARRARVSINVAPEHRGRGVGLRLLELAVETYLAEQSDVHSLDAVINMENTASERIFTAAGFTGRQPSDVPGFFTVTRLRATRRAHER